MTDWTRREILRQGILAAAATGAGPGSGRLEISARQAAARSRA